MCMKANKGNGMYLAVVALLMFILPVLTIGLEYMINSMPDPFMEVVGINFLFWAVGVRLFTAGIRQIIKPELTSEGILGIKDKGARQLARELGFANVSIGLIATLSLWNHAWQMPAALAGGLFLILAGIEHIPKKHRNFEENIAMYSDLFVGLIMAAYLLSGII